MKIIRVDGLFKVKYGVNLEFINLEECAKDDVDSVAFISRTEKNNGISGYVKRLPNIKPNSSKTISVAGGGSVLSTFYHKKEYYSGRDVYVLEPRSLHTEEELLFYAFAIRLNKYRYNYGRQANKTLSGILIPHTMPKGWGDVEIKKIDNLKKKPLRNDLPDFDPSYWEYFPMSALFDIKGSKTTTLDELADYGKGRFPYVTTQTENNGVENSFNYFTEDGNILTVDSAVLGHCTFQPYNFSASDHVEKLMPKFKMNKYLALFLVTIINKEKYRYNYGRKCSQERMKQKFIRLPAKNNKPDWEWMENYIKALPYASSI